MVAINIGAGVSQTNDRGIVKPIGYKRQTVMRKRGPGLVRVAIGRGREAAAKFVWSEVRGAGNDNGTLLEYGRPQGVLRRTNILGQPDRNPGATAAATRVNLVRKGHADGDERRQSSNIEPLREMP